MKRVPWIDTLRGIAIIAVVLDHAFYLYPQYRNDIFWYQTYFSIPWFVFLSGVSNYISTSKKTFKNFFDFYTSFVRSRFSIFFPYLLASSFLYLILKYPSVDGWELGHQILFFSSQPTFYFVNLIFQLYIIFPFLYTLFKSCKNQWQRFLFSLFVFSASFFLARIGQPPWPFSPAGRLFGGLYLSVFYLGIIFADDVRRFIHWRLIAVIIFIILEFVLITTNGSFLGLSPTYPYLLWAISFLFVVQILLERYKGRLFLLFNYLGRHSYFIFLFHFIFLSYFQKILLGSSAILFIFIIISAVFFSLVIEYVYNRMIYSVYHKMITQ